MLFKSMTLAALAAATLVTAQRLSAADMVSNLNHLNDLTRIATVVTQDVVYVDNPLIVRNVTVAIIDAIGTQAVLDEDKMTGQACAGLARRHSGSIASRAMIDQRQASTFTAEEQTNVTNAYSGLVDISHDFMAACNEKHDAVVAHDAAHRMGEALRTTLGYIDTMTDSIMSTVPAMVDVMTSKKADLDQTYGSTIDLYVNGPL